MNRLDIFANYIQMKERMFNYQIYGTVVKLNNSNKVIY